MSEEEVKIPKKISKWLDAKLWVLVALVGKMLFDTFLAGADAQYQVHFQETLKTEGSKNIIKAEVNAEMNSALEDKNFLSKAFSAKGIMNEIDKQVGIAKQHIVDEVIAADNSKIDFVSAVALDSDLRDEKIIPTLAKILKAYEEGEIILKDDIEDLIEEEVKKRTTRNISTRIP